MQDRFKFRIWNKLANMMTYNFMLGNYMQISRVDYEKKDWIGVNYEPEYICFENEGIKNIEIMQCTGLKDKNGKLIYEGDIVKSKLLEDFEAFGVNEKYVEIIAPVIYEYCGFFIEQSENNIFLGQLPPSEIEVIGNIYENPELLKDGE